MAQTTITGPINNVNNDPFANKWIKFTLGQLGTDATAGVTVAQSSDSVQTDASGDFTIDIWDNGESGVESILEVKIEGSRPKYVIIPQGTVSIELWDLIENYPAADADPQLPVVSELFLAKSANLSDLSDASAAQVNLGIVNGSGGGAVGNSASSTFGGVVGNNATATNGGAIGNAATSTSGGAMGNSASSTFGGAVGSGATSTDGGAIGRSATSTDGFAGGRSAIADGTGRVQLGIGTNTTDSTIQFLSSGSVTAAEFGTLAGASASYTAAEETKLAGIKEATTTLVTATTYTVLATDNVILVDDDTAGSDVTVNIPSAATLGDGWTFTIKKMGSTADVILSPDGSETIDGVTTRTIRQKLESTNLVSDGSNWQVMFLTTPNGWAIYVDGTYTSGSPLVLTNGARNLLTIDGNGSTTNTDFLPAGVTDFWDTTNNKITPEKVGDSYDLRIDFAVDVPTNTESIVLELDIGDGSPDIPIVTKGIQFAESGSGQLVSIGFPIFALSTFLANGGKIYLTPSAGGFDIYNIQIFIKRDFSPL